MQIVQYKGSSEVNFYILSSFSIIFQRKTTRIICRCKFFSRDSVKNGAPIIFSLERYIISITALPKLCTDYSKCSKNLIQYYHYIIASHKGKRPLSSTHTLLEGEEKTRKIDAIVLVCV